MQSWQQQVALVTGASSGIGRATAMAFADLGASVVVSDVNDEAGEQLASEIRRKGRNAMFVHADVSKPHDVADLFERTFGEFGHLDIAFNNAGVEGTMASTIECTEENWDQVIGINLKGIWLCMKHELRHMSARGSGAIVNCSSIAGLVGFPQLPAYVASKHGVVGLTRTAALEFAKSGVRVNAVCPGCIRTPMLDRIMAVSPNMQQQLVAGEPVGRLGTPEEIAAAVVWLSSDPASFITGQALAVDGGWIAQ
jgi:NAD(P)-dependent dehydrogenase (short-subunit alcohol dehydrogenase family)